ncbi:MFS transporter [uncultured Ramlibacter sp.]|uniref:MFS transporter n=1 Tax=uncultured Ramlibacter sp. TaxID=260755 RepID=UPI002633BDBC|nr:MFS transporter [uncultured Ramlibacter sp.]
MADGKASQTGFAPLRQPAFAVLWLAAIVGNVGSFMRDVASAWTITELSPTPAAVALIQAAATLPIFLLAIPAGVLADTIDRRRLLIAIQLLLGAVSATLMLLAQQSALTLPWLVGLTFLGGAGAALMGPAWQSIVPELVDRASLRSAVALNSLGINVARAIGPALGGLVLGLAGAALTYGADVLTYVAVVAALLWWKRPPAASAAGGEQFFGALRAGYRFTRASPQLHQLLGRSAVFFVFASAVWALLPLVARQMLHGTPGFYGLLLGAIGMGAIVGAVALPRLRVLLGADGLVLLAAGLVAAAMAGLAFAPPQWLALALMLLMGAGWIIALTTFNGATQSILPDWVRGRALAVYLTVFNGAMTAGSLAWGAVAQGLGIPATLALAAVGLAGAAAWAKRTPLPAGEDDLTPSGHWPQPPLAHGTAGGLGPVLVQIDYQVQAGQRPQFIQTMQALARMRRQGGASTWGLAQDAQQPGTLVEWFVLESWEEHLRQHQRVSHADAQLQHEVLRWHTGTEPPRVRHLLPAQDAG